MATKKDNKKRRKVKGKPLSEKLAEKKATKEADEAAAAAEAEADEDLDEDELDDEGQLADVLDEDDLDEDELDADEDADDADEGDDADEDDDDEDADDEDADDDDRDDDDDDEYEDDDELAAAEMGHQRYVIAGFFALWMIIGFIFGRTLEGAWSQFAAGDWFAKNLPVLASVPYEGDLYSRATISLVVGAILAAGVVIYYYVKPEVRTWADEVAEQLTKVKWPTRKEVSQNTVVVMIATAIITTYLTLLDRFWSFVTNLIYTGT